MQYYQTKVGKITGTDIKEVYQKAMELYDSITKKSKRRAHIRSKYFKKQKIFLGLFWQHIHDKLNHRDKIRRLKCFPCGLEVIRHSNIEPEIRRNPNKTSEIFYRFRGRTKNKELFVVQIKEDTRTNEKFFISTYPE